MNLKKSFGLALLVAFMMAGNSISSFAQTTKPKKPAAKSMKFVMGTTEVFETYKPQNVDPKNYRVLSSGKMVAFEPHQKGISLNKQKKKRVHCVEVKCPKRVKDDITCWKCKKLKPRPKSVRRN